MSTAEVALWKAVAKGDLATLTRLTRLVEEKLNLEATNPGGWTALINAAFLGKLGCLDHLITKGAKLNALDNDKFSALHLAAWAGHAPCVASLLKAGADASLKDEICGETALDKAKRNKHPEVVKILKTPPATAAQAAAGSTSGRGAPQRGAPQAQQGAPQRKTKVLGLADLLAILNLEEHLPAADAWCVEQGADDVSDLRHPDDKYAVQLAMVLRLPPIKADRLVNEINA